MQITSFITEYTGEVPNRQSDTPIAFAQNVYEYQLWIDAHFTPESKLMASQMNELRDEVNDYNISAKSSKDVAGAYATDALTYKNEAQLYRNEALAAKESIDGYLLPTEATYSPATIDNKIQNTRLESFLGFNF